MTSPNTGSTPFPFLSLPKELRLIVYEFLAEEIQHIVIHTGNSQYDYPYCYEPINIEAINPLIFPSKLGVVTLIVPSVPGLALLSTCRTIFMESHSILDRGLKRCVRRAPRVIISYSDLVNTTSSPFWRILRRSLQTLVGRRSKDVPEYQPNCSAEEVYAQYDKPCVIKTPKSRTKKVDYSLRRMTYHQRILFNKFLKHAQRHYRFLEEIGVRKQDPSRVELRLLLAGDTGGSKTWYYKWDSRQALPSDLKIQMVALETEINCLSEVGKCRREGMLLFSWLWMHAAEPNSWPGWVRFGEPVRQTEWLQHWSKG